MNVGDTLYAISQAGLTLRASRTEETLKDHPAENLKPRLAAAIKERKADIIRIMREDEAIRRTGIIQCERQVFDLACEHIVLDKQGDANRWKGNDETDEGAIREHRDDRGYVGRYGPGRQGAPRDATSGGPGA